MRLDSGVFKNENRFRHFLRTFKSQNSTLIALEMRSSINAVIVLTAVHNHQHAAASAAMTAHPYSINHPIAMSMAWNVIEATSRQSSKTGKTIMSRSSKTGGKALKVSKRSKADGLEDESKPQQEEKVTFYVE